MKETETTLHVIAETNVCGEGTLEGGLVRVEIVELDESELAELVNCGMGGASLEVETEEGHVLRAEEGAHCWCFCVCCVGAVVWVEGVRIVIVCNGIENVVASYNTREERG